MSVGGLLAALVAALALLWTTRRNLRRAEVRSDWDASLQARLVRLTELIVGLIAVALVVVLAMTLRSS